MIAQNLSHEVCGVIIECGTVRVVPVFLDCDAVVHRIRSHRSYAVTIVFIVAIFHRILLYGRYSVYTSVGDSKLLLAVTEYHCNSASN